MAQRPPGIDRSASQQPHVLISGIVLYCLAVIAVILRFISRRLAGAGFWWDDWLILPPLVCFRFQGI